MYHIAVIKGDGTGPEVVNEALKVLNTVESKHKIAFQFYELDYNAQRYLSEGKTLGDDELEKLKNYDAVLFGAIGDPRVTSGILERDILLKIRFGLDQYINLRPVRLYPGVASPVLYKEGFQDLDYVVIRENTGGVYTGKGSVLDKGSKNETVSQIMHYTYEQVERCLRYSFEYVRRRHLDSPWKFLDQSDLKKGYIGKLTLCGKSNVLSYVFDLWLRLFEEIGKEYPDIKRDYVHVDACCIYMIDAPHMFDVLVTTNMFGDIITDLAAVTQGGLGVASGANINPDGVSMFEPIGGTAPDFTGRNEINPIASIGAAQLMLDHLGERQAALDIDSAKLRVIKGMDSQEAAKMGCSTQEVGDRVVAELLK
ncbi:MAG: 3-isopropylmalate dehydrogenase [bacterium]